MRFDAFAEPFTFLLPEGKDAYRSCKGCTLTVMLVLALIFYGSMQSIKLLTFDETDIMVSSKDAAFDTYEIFTEGLMYSFGITAYDSNREPIEDPTIGVLKPYYKSWGLMGSSGVHFEELPTRECTEAEFHINGKSDPDSLFFKPHSTHAKDI